MYCMKIAFESLVRLSAVQVSGIHLRGKSRDLPELQGIAGNCWELLGIAGNGAFDERQALVSKRVLLKDAQHAARSLACDGETSQ